MNVKPLSSIDLALAASLLVLLGALSWRLQLGLGKQLAIVRLLHQQPRCLLLDEPTASLDQVLVARVENLLVTYGRTHNAPMLWVSHDPAQLERVSHHCLFMTSDGLLIDEKVTA